MVHVTNATIRCGSQQAAAMRLHPDKGGNAEQFKVASSETEGSKIIDLHEWSGVTVSC